MFGFDSTLLVAMAAIVVTACALVVDFIQTRAIRQINAKTEEELKEWRERGTIGEQFGEWLMFREPSEDSGKPNPSNMEILMYQAGQSYAKSMRLSVAADQSALVRSQNATDKTVFEALKDNDPVIRDICTGLEVAGIEVNPNTVESALRFVKRFGWDGWLKGNGDGRSSNRSLERA